MAALSELLSQVSASWIYNSGRYPAMAGLYKAERLDYTLGHVGVHMTKSVVPLTMDVLALLAEIATDTERTQHARADMTPERRAKWKELVAKLLINTLGFATVLEMDAAELEVLVAKILAANN